MATFTARPPVCSELRLFSIQGFKGTDAVFFNGTASKFKVVSDTYLTAVVPKGATTGFVIVSTSEVKLKSNKKFQVLP